MRRIRMENTHHSLISDGVPEHEQTLATDKPFWVFFAGNLCVATWLMGVFVAAMGLDLVSAILTILAGSLVGALLPALTSIMGPKLRLSQMEIGRFSLGQTGKKLPALLNWVGCIGWDAINNIASSTALVLWLGTNGIQVPFWVILAVLVGIQTIVGVYGHHFVQDFSKYSSYVVMTLFVVVGLISMSHAASLSPPKPAGVIGILSAFVLLVSYNTGGWTTYTADYTRYLPRQTPLRTVFAVIFFGLFLSFFIMVFFGYMTAAAVVDQTPEGVMKALQNLTGPFSGLALFVVGISCIPPNAVNDNSAAYSLLSSGVKIARPTAAVIGAVVGYAVAVSASHSFMEFFENFLLLFEHWVTPWAAIVVVHWLIVDKQEEKTVAGLTWGLVIFILVTIGSIILFSSNALYTGPMANKLGDLDVGPYVGFVMAGLLYYILLRGRWINMK